MTSFAPPPLVSHVPSSPSSFPSLSDEIVVSIFARIPRSYYNSLCLVSKSFYALLSSPEIYFARSQTGNTEPRLYMCMCLPSPKKHSWFSLQPIKDRCTMSLAPVRLSSLYAPARLNSTTVAVGFEIYQIGGTVRKKPSKAVRVLDCQNNRWRRAPGLIRARKRAKSFFLDGEIYVIGGVKESSMNWGEVFDIKYQTWKPLSSPSNNRVLGRNHQVVVFGGMLFVITEHNNYAYDPKEGRWLGLFGLGKELKITGPCCVIENVIFADCGGEYKGYDSRSGVWLTVDNLRNLYVNRHSDYQTLHLVNHGGKLAIIWHERLKFHPQRSSFSRHDRKIVCMVIRLLIFGTHIFGKIEHWVDVVRVVPRGVKMGQTHMGQHDPNHLISLMVLIFGS